MAQKSNSTYQQSGDPRLDFLPAITQKENKVVKILQAFGRISWAVSLTEIQIPEFIIVEDPVSKMKVYTNKPRVVGMNSLAGSQQIMAWCVNADVSRGGNFSKGILEVNGETGE